MGTEPFATVAEAAPAEGAAPASNSEKPLAEGSDGRPEPEPGEASTTTARVPGCGSIRTIVASAIRRGVEVDDRAFDRFLAPDLRAHSGCHWSPVGVALRAAGWCDALDLRTVVDVGSGAGKFCVVAALASRSRFIGVEQRPRLVAAARSLARTFDVEDRATFVDARFGATPLPKADAYYFYNPFGENLLGSPWLIDSAVELGEERYRGDVAAATALLHRVPVGTHVMTYNGFGGRIPSSFVEVLVDREAPNVLRVWRKAHPASV